MPASAAPAPLTAAPPRAVRLRSDPVLLAVFGYVVLRLWHAIGGGGLRAQSVMFWVFQVPLDLTLFFLGRRVVRLAGMPVPARRFWNAFAISGLFFATGDLIQSVVMLGLQPLAGAVPGVGHELTLVAGVALPLGAMLAFPTPTGSRQEQIRFWLDGGAVMAAAMVFAWYFSVSPGGADTTAARLPGSLVGVGVELVAAFAVVKLLLTGAAGFVRAAGLTGAVAAAVMGLANVATPALLHSPYLPALLAVQLIAAGALISTPRMQELRVRADPLAISGRNKRPYSLLPYASIAATLGLLVVVLRNGLDLRGWGVLVGVIVITALVVVRQLAAFTDNARLLTRLDEQQRLLQSLVQHASDITVITRDGRIAYASPALERVLGVLPEDAIGQPSMSLVHHDDLAGLRRRLGELDAVPRASVSYEIRVQHTDGSWRWLEAISTNLRDDPAVSGIVTNARDITESREHQQLLRHQASHDPLTQLANRALFTDRAEDAVRAGEPAAILLIDLDDFKAVNDTLGHHVGDELLVAVAGRLRACVRPDDTVARLGGDEFAVLLPRATDEDAVAVAERIMAAFGSPVDAAGHSLTVQASVGLATGTAADPDGLLRAADSAMYSAKRSGKGTYAQFRP